MHKQAIAVVVSVIVVAGAFYFFTNTFTKVNPNPEQNPSMQGGNSSGVETINPESLSQ